MVQHVSESAQVSELERPLDDDWLDTIEGHPQRRTAIQVMQDSFTGPARWARRMSLFVATTPGRIVAMMVILTLALVAAGAAMSQSMASRQRALDALITATEPMSNSAHLLYTTLSQADTVATTSFVQPGLLSEDQVQLYVSSIDRAAVTAAAIHQGARSREASNIADEVSHLVTEILRDLPVYSALMERAKVNQRLGNPVGVAYMTEASHVMREQMLRDAARLSTITQDEVAREVARLSSPQWVPLSGLIAALVFLLLAQWRLWRIFHRRFNRGFLLATAAIIVAIVLLGFSNFKSLQSGVVGFERAAQPWQRLADARVHTQETRTDETLALLSRQSVSRSAQSFDLTSKNVREALDAVEALETDEATSATVASARRALDDWSAAHRELVSALADGRFEPAMDILNNPNPAPGPAGRSGSAAAYNQLDADLQELINYSRENTRAYINASLDATRLVATAVALLSLAAVVCIWFGIRRRLGEYL